MLYENDEKPHGLTGDKNGKLCLELCRHKECIVCVHVCKYHTISTMTATV